MKEQEYIVILYDYYGELFNDKQREYFEDYYFDNLSLSEIADNSGVSRNAIHKGIKNVVNKLYEYEDKLKLYEKDNKLKAIIDKVSDKVLKEELEELLWRKNHQVILKI